MNHPIQPIEPDKNGTMRFKENAIVNYLLDNGPFDMNDLAILDFSNDDREQFAQLIGYSVGGFGELSYVSDDTYGTACKIIDEGMTEEQAKIAHFEEELKALREGLAESIARLYGKHIDDLTEKY